MTDRDSHRAPLAAVIRPGRGRRSKTTEPPAELPVTQPLPQVHPWEGIDPETDPCWAAKWALSFAAQTHRDHDSETLPWFESLFDEDYLSAYRERSGDAETDFILNLLDLKGDDPLLDLACGDGRLAIPLARSGLNLTALDLSLPMLSRCSDRAEEEGLDIQLCRQDMRDLSFDADFRAVLLMGHSFGYFSDVENLLVLRGIHRALMDRGLFLLDLVNRDSIIRKLPLRTWFEAKDCLIQEDVTFNPIDNRVSVQRFVMFTDGRDRIDDFSLRLYSLHEIYAMLDLVGFEFISCSGSIHTPGFFAPSDSERMIVLAQKKPF